MSDSGKVTPTDDPNEILKIMHDCYAAKLKRDELFKKTGRVEDATASNHTGCYTDGAYDSD